MLCSNCKKEVNLEFCYCKSCGARIEQVVTEQQADKQEKIDSKIILGIICSSFISSLIIMITHNTNINRIL